MSKITPGQIKRLHQLLNELGMIENKAELVAEATNGRTTSSKDLGIDEARVLITRLADLALEKDKIPNQRTDVMRKKIFSLCRQIGYIYGTSEADRKMNQVVIYGMVKRLGYLKKDLMAYTAAELPKLVNQFVAMAKNNNKAAASAAVKDLLAELNIEVK